MKKRRFRLCALTVVGTQYQNPHLLAKVGEADELQLEREPENVYDPSAVAVLWEGERIGFVPRDHAPTLAALIDHGFRMRATVDYAAKGIVTMDVWMYAAV